MGPMKAICRASKSEPGTDHVSQGSLEPSGAGAGHTGTTVVGGPDGMNGVCGGRQLELRC